MQESPGIVSHNVRVADQGGQPAIAGQNEGLEHVAVGEVHDHAAAIPENPHRCRAVSRLGGGGVDLCFKSDPTVEVQAQPATESPAHQLGRNTRPKVRILLYVLVASQRVLGIEEVNPTKNAEVEAELRWFLYLGRRALGFRGRGLGLGSGLLPARQQDKSAQCEHATTKPSLR